MPRSSLYRRLLLSSCAVAAAAALVPAWQATAAEPPAPVAFRATNFSGTVKFDGCSGSLVRFATSQITDKAVLMTNGHCMSTDFKPGEVWADKAYSKGFKPQLLKPDGKPLEDLTVERIMYATMTNTDVAFLRSNKTFQQLITAHGDVAQPHLISSQEPVVGSTINIITSFWEGETTCAYEAKIYNLKEENWTWKDSIRYASQCATKGGWSGSPIFDATSRLVVGIHNTGNDDGSPKCGMNNPCEFDAQGRKNIIKGRRYGQQIWWVNSCLGENSSIDLRKPGCALPK